MPPKRDPLMPSRHCDEHSRETKGCDPCRLARNAYERTLKGHHRKGYSARLDITGTRRRLEAMQRLGYGPVVLGRMLGTSKGNIQRLRYTQKYISREYAERIDALYRKLASKPANGGPPHRRTTQTKAALRGMAPPFAWDDIDKDEAPQGMEPPSFMRVNEKLEEAAFLRSYGLTEETIADRLGVSVRTLRGWSYPSGRERRGAA